MARMVLIPKRRSPPSVVAILCIIGAYAINSSVFDILIMAIFGLIGFVMKEGYSVAPMVLGIVLGSLMDANFRRAVSLASARRQSDNLNVLKTHQHYSYCLHSHITVFQF